MPQTVPLAYEAASPPQMSSSLGPGYAHKRPDCLSGTTRDQVSGRPMFSWDTSEGLHSSKAGTSSASEQGSPDKSPTRAAAEHSPPLPAAPANADIELSRRAVPVIEADDDVCSICLEEYTQQDPGNRTACKHCFHLQCVMQWAQRSRECPLCFKPLQLEDHNLNELLPFGEYIPPERLAANGPCVLMGLDAWELERLLQRLAVPGGARRDRRSRARAVTSHPATEASGRPLPFTLTGAQASTSAANGDVPRPSYPEDVHPSSWPPHSSDLPHRASTASPPPAGDLRSRWAAVSNRCRESLQKTTRELKGRWSLAGRDRLPLSPRSNDGEASGDAAQRSMGLGQDAR